MNARTPQPTSKPIPELTVWGGTVLTLNPKNPGEILSDVQIDIVNGRIFSIHPCEKPAELKAKKVIDARDCLVMPGFINGHTHTGMTLLRGCADDMPLHAWLTDKIFPLEKKWGSEEFVYLGTLLALLEMIRGGTTLFNDMYYFEAMAARAVHESGIRAVCAQTLVEISGVEDSGEMADALDRYLSQVQNYYRVIPAIGPHSIYGVSEKSWEKVSDYAATKKWRVHLHLQETKEELERSVQSRKLTPTAFFEKIGLWNSPCVAAHAVYLTDSDIEILKRYRVGVVHNPESNLKLGNGIAPVTRLREAGVKVAIGTDGAASNNNLDLLQEASTAIKLQALLNGVGKLKALDMVQMLTIEGAEALRLDHEIGSLEVGKSADLIALDLNAPHAVPLFNPFSHLVYSASGSDVKHSVVGGSVIMEDRKILTLDEEAILAEAKRWGKILAQG